MISILATFVLMLSGVLIGNALASYKIINRLTKELDKCYAYIGTLHESNKVALYKQNTKEDTKEEGIKSNKCPVENCGMIKGLYATCDGTIHKDCNIYKSRNILIKEGE